MKKSTIVIAALMLVFGIACTPEDNTPKEVLATAIELSSHELTIEKGESTALTVRFTPYNVTKKDVVWVSSNTSIATVNDGIVVGVETGETEISAKCGDAVDRCKVVVSPSIPKGAVDLGIIMTREDGSTYSLYWAECNLGATKPEEFGDYYAWGETEIKTNYSWETYKWCEGSYSTLTKYNTCNDWGVVDNIISLDPDDDAAHVILGGSWRIPTDTEWEELITQCTWIWTTENGVKGRKITGSSGDSIFLPAAGYQKSTELINFGTEGIYWSSFLFSDNYRARGVTFESVYLSSLHFSRYFGHSIRPVTE